jgi:hypothetical protein
VVRRIFIDFRGRSAAALVLVYRFQRLDVSRVVGRCSGSRFKVTG